MGKRRDPAEWTAYGRSGAGRPKIARDVEQVSATIPAAHAAALDEIAAARGVKRPDIIREAISEYLRRHQGTIA